VDRSAVDKRGMLVERLRAIALMGCSAKIEHNVL
jgi:hypothetical protein